MSTTPPAENIIGVAVHVIHETGKPWRAIAAPTQVRRPWRATLRTVVWTAVAVATLVPFIVTGVYQDGSLPAVVVQLLAVAGAVTRVMALPQVEAFLQLYVPWLAAAPAAARDDLAPDRPTPSLPDEI